ncbi:MAG TPA: hypothetical protein VMS17_32185, partial [Gemmataceae bacterium]|nr:hypothetical protein [Gemmataceae bacterium]
NDLDIPALEVLEDALQEFTGALVLVSHDRALMDRLCTEVVGLDGRGGSAVYASAEQWLAAYERAAEEAKKPAAPPAGTNTLQPQARRRRIGASVSSGEGGRSGPRPCGHIAGGRRRLLPAWRRPALPI